ncbi:hypothetical protein OH76DRAFT_991718 [Lentinus brumalis]|uniref:F-box domain-containing protein n=1 Tax=Lentinus brumalis TaxID=2498619 RepID=A0A371DQC8_9APHY|nr:hypothetical protein OH76DRAFT_991718 [Polyporus brumalis]
MMQKSMEPAVDIHDLPFEVLIHIFRFIRPTWRGNIRYAHVCRRLRAAIHDTPEFWRDMIDIQRVLRSSWSRERSKAFLAVFLERAQQLPLHINLVQSEFDTLETRPLGDYLDRISVLFVQWERGDFKCELRGRLLALGPLPTLESLECTYEDPEYTRPHSLDMYRTPSAVPCTDWYPKLSYLEVNPDFLMDAVVVPSLRTLLIHMGYASLSGILATLRHCPLLERLHIGQIFEPTYVPIESMSPVPLLHLHEWTMFDSYECPGFPEVMLRHIQCPPTTRIALHPVGPYNKIILSEVVPKDRIEGGSHIGALSAVLPTTTTLDIQIVAGGDRWVSKNLFLKWYAPGEDVPRLCITMSYRVGDWNGGISPTSLQPYPYMLNITFAFSSQTITDLRLDLANEPTPVFMRRIDWTILFDAFPALIALTARLRSCAGLLRALRQAPLRLGRLERLEVTCANKIRVHHALVITLEMRANQGLRLRLLGFCHSNDDAGPFSDWHLARLRAVVAEVITSFRREPSRAEYASPPSYITNHAIHPDRISRW